MFALRIGVLMWWSILAMAIAGCAGNSTAFASDPVQQDVFAARPAGAKKGILVEIKNNIGGDIIILPQSQDEVALDYTVTGTGSDPDAAIMDARNSITVTMTTPAQNGQNEYFIWAKPNMDAEGTSMPVDAGDQVKIYVRVPLTAPLKLMTKAGNITVAGVVGSVAARTNDGTITVLGAEGKLDLSTKHGSIVAHGGSQNDIHLSAIGGDITLYAVNATVTATTTEGSLLFVGTLRPGAHLMQTTKNGNIVVALPLDFHYQFQAWTSGSQIIADFRSQSESPNPPNQPMPVCGIVEGNTAYDYHIRQVNNVPFARLELNMITTTRYLSGTLAGDYYKFYTNHRDITFITPFPHAIHLDIAEKVTTALDHSGSTDAEQSCKEILGKEENPATLLTLSTERGRIQIHHMQMSQQ